METKGKTMRATRSKKPLPAIPTAVLLILFLTGCARFDLRRNIPWQEEPEETPASVVAFWTDAVLERSGGPPYRGFGGRILFYSRDLTRSIRAKGTLVVYAFNDDLPPPENLKPIRKFVFTAEQLAEMESPSNMGPSYSVLVPWDQFSQEPQRISLMVRLIPEAGGSIISEQARVFLPGLGNPQLASPKSYSSSSSHGVRTAAASLPKESPAQDAIQPTSFVDTLPSRGGTRGGSPAMTSSRAAQAGFNAAPPRRMQTLTLDLGSRNPAAHTAGADSAKPSQSSGASSITPGATEHSTLRARSEEAASHAHMYMESATMDSATAVEPNSTAAYGNWGGTTSWESATRGFETPPSPGQMIRETAQQPSTGFRPAQYPVPIGLAAPPTVDLGRTGRSLEAPPFGLGR